MMRRLLAEPLVHFALIGLVVFAGDSIWRSLRHRAEETIHVSIDEIERLAGIWANETGRLPSDTDIEGLVGDFVREEVLYREAMRLGLDRKDTIIRRRLAQKMRFMLDDTTELPEPDDLTLRAAFEAAPDRYATSETLSFSHVYLSPEVHGKAIESDAEQLLRRLRKGDQDWRQMGDAFMLPRQFGALSETDVTRLFGKAFSDALFASKTGGWQGPIASAFGLHLVRIENRRPGEPATFDSVRSRVLADYMATARDEANAATLEKVMARYKVEIEAPE